MVRMRDYDLQYGINGMEGQSFCLDATPLRPYCTHKKNSITDGLRTRPSSELPSTLLVVSVTFGFLRCSHDG
jgi:hypothetical protein